MVQHEFVFILSILIVLPGLTRAGFGADDKSIGMEDAKLTSHPYMGVYKTAKKSILGIGIFGDSENYCSVILITAQYGIMPAMCKQWAYSGTGLLTKVNVRFGTANPSSSQILVFHDNNIKEHNVQEEWIENETKIKEIDSILGYNIILLKFSKAYKVSTTIAPFFKDGQIKNQFSTDSSMKLEDQIEQCKLVGFWNKWTTLGTFAMKLPVTDAEKDICNRKINGCLAEDQLCLINERLTHPGLCPAEAGTAVVCKKKTGQRTELEDVLLGFVIQDDASSACTAHRVVRITRFDYHLEWIGDMTGKHIENADIIANTFAEKRAKKYKKLKYLGIDIAVMILLLLLIYLLWKLLKWLYPAKAKPVQHCVCTRPTRIRRN